MYAQDSRTSTAALWSALDTLVFRYQHTCIVVLALCWLFPSREPRVPRASSDSSRETSSEDPGESEQHLAPRTSEAPQGLEIGPWYPSQQPDKTIRCRIGQESFHLGMATYFPVCWREAHGTWHAGQDQESNF